MWIQKHIVLCLQMLGASAVLAQSAGDTTWRAYFPLTVGNAWEFERWRSDKRTGLPPRTDYVRWEVVREDPTHGAGYFRIRTTAFAFFGGPASHVDSLSVRLSEEGRPVRSEQDRARLNEDYPWIDWVDLRSRGRVLDAIWTFTGLRGQARVTAVRSYGTDYPFFLSVIYFGQGIGLVQYTAEYPYEERVVSYRLRRARVGGETFEVVSVGSESEAIPLQAGSIELFPNPASASMVVTYTQSSSAQASVHVYDLIGRMVMRHELGGASNGRSRHVVNVSDLAAGVYVMRVDTGGEVLGFTRFVVQR
jgi:hypothetical protein